MILGGVARRERRPRGVPAGWEPYGSDASFEDDD
jgi:hypothetical protein